MPTLPATGGATNLVQGWLQRAASAVSCGWCGSIRRAWRAKRGAHASLPAAAPPHRALLPSPEAHGTEDVAVWRSAPPGAMAYVGLRWLLLTLLSRLDAGGMGVLKAAALEKRRRQPKVRLHIPGTQPKRPPSVCFRGCRVAKL